MEVVNVHQAKTHLSKLLRVVEQGQEVVICRTWNARCPSRASVGCKSATPICLQWPIWRATTFSRMVCTGIPLIGFWFAKAGWSPCCC